MDGLPVQEANTCDYRSIHENRMHACGHDGHMAMVLTLGQYVDTLDELGCNVLLIFQPAEETLGGAREICESGILKQYTSTRIFGIHMWPFGGSREDSLQTRSTDAKIRRDKHRHLRQRRLTAPLHMKAWTHFISELII